MIRHVAGAIFLAAGAALIVSAMTRRTRALAAARDPLAPKPPPLHPSLAMMGEIVPPLVIFGLVIAGAQVVLAFWMTDGGGVFSLFDLLGFLFLLVAYGIWIKAKTRFRLAPAAR